MPISQPLFDIFEELGITNATVVIWITRIAALIAVWVIVWILVRYLSRWIQGVDKRIEGVDVSTRDLKTIDRLLDYVVILIGIIVSLAILGWTSLLVSALTAAGVFSVIIGFAVRDVAANFISGIFILIDQPFVVGDFIESGGTSGTVQNVSLRTTTIVTVDGPLVHIPNSILAVQPTTNYTVAEDRRISFNISVAADADVDLAVRTIEQVLADEEGLLAERTQLVLVNELREYAIDILVICYAPTATFMALSSGLKQQVMDALHEAGVEPAVPVRKTVALELDK
jgi:small conductance mechanosensitive channel